MRLSGGADGEAVVCRAGARCAPPVASSSAAGSTAAPATQPPSLRALIRRPVGFPPPRAINPAPALSGAHYALAPPPLGEEEDGRRGATDATCNQVLPALIHCLHAAADVPRRRHCCPSLSPLLSVPLRLTRDGHQPPYCTTDRGCKGDCGSEVTRPCNGAPPCFCQSTNSLPCDA